MTFFTNGYHSLGEEGVIKTDRFFRDGSELAKFIDKILNQYDGRPSIIFTCNVFRYFKNSRRVNRAENGQRTDKFNSILEYEVENC